MSRCGAASSPHFFLHSAVLAWEPLRPLQNGIAHAVSQTLPWNLVRDGRHRSRNRRHECGCCRCPAHLSPATRPSSAWTSSSRWISARPASPATAAPARALPAAAPRLCLDAGLLALEPTGRSLCVGFRHLGGGAPRLALRSRDLGAQRPNLGLRARALGALSDCAACGSSPAGREILGAASRVSAETVSDRSRSAAQRQQGRDAGHAVPSLLLRLVQGAIRFRGQIILPGTGLRIPLRDAN